MDLKSPVSNAAVCLCVGYMCVGRKLVIFEDSVLICSMGMIIMSTYTELCHHDCWIICRVCYYKNAAVFYKEITICSIFILQCSELSTV